MPDIYDMREGLLCRDSDGYKAWHEQKMAQQRAKGVRRAEVQAEGTDAKPAYINHNRWLVDCDCGAGVYVDTDLLVARCAGLGCGAVIKCEMPSEREAIEAALLRRPQVVTRNWRPGESVADLQRENAENGI